MGTAVVDDEVTPFTAVIAYQDAIKRWSVTVNNGPDSPTGVAVGDVGEGFDVVLDAAIESLRRQQRALYRSELSEPWKAWRKVSGKSLSLKAKVGGPSAMLKLSRGLQVTATTTVHNAVTLSTGEVQVVFTEQHKDGNGPITTPNLFFLNIPVFEGGDAYQVAVRLRYRLNEGKLSWSLVLYRDDKIFDAAFNGVIAKVKEETDVAIYLGEPEN